MVGKVDTALARIRALYCLHPDRCRQSGETGPGGDATAKQPEQPIDDGNEAVMAMLRVGTSAGGARPKAIVAINPAGNIISGQGSVPDGYEHWILKFDGVTDMEPDKPQEYGRIEYTYHCLSPDGQSLRHRDERMPTARRAWSRSLHAPSLRSSGGPQTAHALALRHRPLRFQCDRDDHTKNIAFLMDRDGQWKLSPAYDVTYSHNPAGRWTNQHQMSAGGKRDGFTRDDLLSIGRSIRLPRPEEVLEEIIEAVRQWPEFSNQAGVSSSGIDETGKAHRLEL